MNMNKKLDNQTLEFIIKYLGGQIIGSYLFVSNFKYLILNDINDIDIMLLTINQQGIEQYLIDNGYIQQLEQRKYSEPVKTNVFKKEGYIDIHLLYYINKLPEIYNLKQLLNEKINRLNSIDLIQLKKIFNNMK